MTARDLVRFAKIGIKSEIERTCAIVAEGSLTPYTREKLTDLFKLLEEINDMPEAEED